MFEALDFIAWVDNYMNVDEPREYRYTGADLYKARYSLLHQFATHEKYPMKFAYVDSGPHRYRKDFAPHLVILSVEQLADGLWNAIARFLAAARRTRKWPLVEARFAQMYESSRRDDAGIFR